MSKVYPKPKKKVHVRSVHQGVLVHETLPDEYFFVDTFPDTGQDFLNIISGATLIRVLPGSIYVNGCLVPHKLLRNVLASGDFSFDIPAVESLQTTCDFGTELCGLTVKIVYSRALVMYILDHSRLETFSVQLTIL